MRIVAGRLKGRDIVAPNGRDTRPTSDRVRESLFNILEHGIEEFALNGARVVDLFAGSGALGLEALSRGAQTAVFVETGMEARAAIRENIIRFALAGQTRILKRDATDLGPCPRNEPFDLAFLDPPYRKGLAERAIVALMEGRWLKSRAVVMIEEHKAVDVDLPAGLAMLDQRVYGETRVTLARLID